MIAAPDEIPESVLSDLARVSHSLPVFATLDWFEHLRKTSLLPGQQGRYLICNDAAHQAATGFLPCLRSRSGIAWRVEALSNFYTPLYSVPAPSAHFASMVGELAQAVSGGALAADILDLRPLDPFDPFVPVALDAFKRADLWADTYFCFWNWYLEVRNRSFDQYFDSLESRVRNTVRRAQRRFEKQAGEIIIHCGQTDDLDSAIDAFTAVYAASWKRPEPFPDFIPGLCRVGARNGWLRLGVLQLDGCPVASQLWLVKDGTASIYKLAYDSQFAHLSPGSILTAALLRHVIDQDRVEAVDYLVGDDAYKREWMSQRRQRIGIVAFNRRRIPGLLAAARHFGGKSARTLLARAPATSSASVLPRHVRPLAGQDFSSTNR